MISTLTKAECIDALSHFDRDDIVVATCTFGDRARTMQAVPLGDSHLALSPRQATQTLVMLWLNRAMKMIVIPLFTFRTGRRL